MPKMLFMSHCVPPIARGPSIIIYRLLRQFPCHSYGILTSRIDGEGVPVDDELRLNCKYHYVNIDTIVGGYKTSLLSILNKWLEAFPVIVKGIKVIKGEKYDRLLVSPSHGNFLLAAYLIHKICGIKYYVYLFDLFWSRKEPKGLESFLKSLTEKLALKPAECVFVMSERLQEYYHNKYPHLKLRIIRHPIELEQYRDAGGNSKEYAARSTLSRIVFSGMIYEYQVDAIQNLVKAVNGLKDVEVHIYTQRSAGCLERMGISGNNIFYHGYVSNKELTRIQQAADILFLPMSFHGAGTDPDIIKTASPSKLSEYLASGRPILVHAPEDSYVVWYAKKYGWGLVVDETRTETLKRAVLRLVNDEKLRRELAENARKTQTAHEAGRVFRVLSEEMGFYVYTPVGHKL